MSQLRLLPDRRFWPLFWTQFLGAFNDNLFKNALVIMITYRALSLGGLGPEQLVPLSSGIFIAPYFLFSATAGQLSDKYPKATIVRATKVLELLIMAVGAIGLHTQSVALLLSVLFLLGLQSTFFGPAKYSILPELLEEDELVGGNALVETGTFVSILIGTIVGGVLIALPSGDAILAVLGLVVAVFGLVTAGFIKKRPGAAPDLPVALNPFTPTWQTYQALKPHRAVYLSILGISWFWFLGAALLSILPTYCRDQLHGNEHVVTFFLALFCVGIALGSLLCERLSGERLELGLVPFGSLGMSFFTFDLFLLGAPVPAGSGLLTLSALLAQPPVWRVAVDLFGVALFSGFFTVPLYTLIQQRSPAELRSRVVAGNNILNALFMVISAALLMGLAAVGADKPQVFLVLALLNAAVAVYIYGLLPEFLLRFACFLLANVLYRLKVTGREHVPAEGAAVLVANHVSFVDWLIVAAAVKRPARFVMYHGYFKMPVIGMFFRDAKVIPIAPAHEDEGTLSEAFDQIAAELAAGELVVIFPEGKITKDGALNPFRTGIERIIARTPVPVVPMGIHGMWGSFFSRKDGPAMKRPFRRFWSRIGLVIGPPVPPGQVTAQRLAEKVAALCGLAVPAPAPVPSPQDPG